MILCNTILQKIITEDIEQQKRFATPTNASDNLHHSIAYTMDKLSEVIFAFKNHYVLVSPFRMVLLFVGCFVILILPAVADKIVV